MNVEILPLSLSLSLLPLSAYRFTYLKLCLHIVKVLLRCVTPGQSIVSTFFPTLTGDGVVQLLREGLGRVSLSKHEKVFLFSSSDIVFILFFLVSRCSWWFRFNGKTIKPLALFASFTLIDLSKHSDTRREFA